MMKILTWNINGIRSTPKNMSMKCFLDSLDADIICLQETKITRNLLTEDIANVEGYYAFFSFSRRRSGYSGVATFCKRAICPCAAEEGLNGTLYDSKPKKIDQTLVGTYDSVSELDEDILKSVDEEGRVIITEHQMENSEKVCIVNVYCPCTYAENQKRYSYKLNFYQCLEARCRALLHSGKHLIVLGDMNICHRRMDHCDPDDDFDESEARKWIERMLIPSHPESESDYVDTPNDELVDQNSSVENDDDSHERRNHSIWVDMFRRFHPDEKSAYTCWNTKSRARETNYGTRIDYIFASEKIALNVFKECNIHPEIQGSDHCPVVGVMDCEFVKSNVIPTLCTANMPEVCGKQQRIKSYFSKQKICKNEELEENLNEAIQSSQGKRKVVVELAKQAKRQCLSEPDKKKGSLFGYFSKTSRCSQPKNEEKVVEAKLLNNTDLFLEETSNKPEEKFLKSDVCVATNVSLKIDRTHAKCAWKNILKGPPPVPLCSVHKEKTVVRTVKKEGPNYGRQFYVCNRPVGHSSNKEASCGYFLWKS